ALRCCADRARSRPAARAGRREGNGQADPPRATERRLRRTGRDRRPARRRPGRGSTRSDGSPDGAYRRAGGVTLSVLLAVDGDSFAHRAYHGLPKSVRLNAIVGWTNMMTRLWQAERPDAVLVGWDTLEVPTYRHEAYEPYQSGRIFEESLLEQLALMPALTEVLG